MTAPSLADVEQFRELVVAQMGLVFEDSRLPFLEGVLRTRIAATRADPASYLARLTRPAAGAEHAALAELLTIGETYFFRNPDQLRALAEAVLPERARAVAPRRLRVLSAGCASGDEPYSIAIMAAIAGIDVAVRAVDINPAALERARAGRYTAWSLRETSDEQRRRWFREDGRELVLDPAIRARVSFHELNLTADEPGFWLPGAFDVIFCRNVLMYFSPAQATAVVDRFARALGDGGYLFLGHAETLRGLSHAFDLCHTHNTFYYRALGSAVPAPAPALTELPPELAAVGDDDTSWVAAIRGAAERVAALTDTSAPRAPAAPRWDLAAALDLVRREQFAAALDVVHGLPAESQRDPGVLLLRAVLLTHARQLALAEDACHRVLARDALDAGAHYLLALCREDAGALAAAIEHDQLAIHLDPAFAMPRLHLGMLARRTGDHATARRELERALELLEREDASRLLLFGGGFNRGALIALCRAQLALCRGLR